MKIYKTWNEELAKGVKKLNLEVGIVSKIEGTHYTVETCTNNNVDIKPGSEFELSDTYCADVIKTGKTRFYEDTAEITELLKHPCYLNIQLRAYIGTPLFKAGKICGTLNYSSRCPRTDGYSKQEIEFVESQARRIEKLIMDEDT